MEPEFARNAAFHDQVAPRYDEQLAVSPYNALARTAFQDLVKRYVPPGSTILDFGCGTGIDAETYVKAGYRVVAYDNSPGMVRQLNLRCAASIEAGEIFSYSTDYPSFLSRLDELPAPHAVTADFAVLNSIPNLSPLFDGFAGTLQPPGLVIVSILNPWHWSKVRMPGWWREAWRAPRGPRVYARQPYESYLHFVPAVLKAAQGFRLAGRANAGAVVRYDPRLSEPNTLYWRGTAGARADSLWRTPAYKLLGHFIFLVFRRDF